MSGKNCYYYSLKCTIISLNLLYYNYFEMFVHYTHWDPNPYFLIVGPYKSNLAK